ncbi:hypothetical protein CDAR_615971 [Caerostris darwini]|uniref:Uncharacterized protein n=1 Tax=Caerostris darwini TaxID=1538125 RepID=A0AAV4RUF6_9ARAC|nr:hypothetical protein CDAR_615971 [Caerostris darwini]
MARLSSGTASIDPGARKTFRPGAKHFQTILPKSIEPIRLGIENWISSEPTFFLLTSPLPHLSTPSSNISEHLQMRAETISFLALVISVAKGWNLGRVEKKGKIQLSTERRGSKAKFRFTV